MSLGEEPTLLVEPDSTASPAAGARTESDVARMLRGSTAHLQPDDVSFVKQQDSLLGRGSFGVVYRGSSRGTPVAIKSMRILRREHRDMFLDEIDRMSKITHPNVVTFMGAFELQQRFYIVCELMDRDLRAFLQERRRLKKPVSEVIKLKLLLDAARGMAWLHGSQPQFIHRDLKTVNILVDESQMVAKVSDFGLCLIMDSNLRSCGINEFAGSYMYMAPEVVARQPVTDKVDVWSYAFVLWEVLTGKATDQTEFAQEMRKSYDSARRQAVIVPKVTEGNLRPPVDDVPDRLAMTRPLVGRCWSTDPKQRPSFAEVVNELCEAILNLTIPAGLATLIWRRLSLMESGSLEHDPLVHISWSVPIRALITEMIMSLESEQSVTDQQIRSMSKMLTHFRANELGTVSNGVQLSQFGAFASAFDGLRPSVFKQVHSLVTTKGFFGQLDDPAEKSALVASGPGSYLLRFGSTPGSITATCAATANEGKKFRIHYDADGFFLSGKPEVKTETLSELLRHDPLATFCLKPCSGGPFDNDGQQLFQDASYWAPQPPQAPVL
eukprot:TRINITY_DN798_c0_g1_i3.p1 TRINITY_DN798_c0_g1~~TRINITY_DN798_c0_g1_i3.p1  ORF type:complete len:553 (+),score=83.68 TRINITY_DN798_c0_g1_i3:358-2016(+)